jgi:hypothetical protein
MDPASIRYYNPGGQYPGPVSARHGSQRHEIIGGGHKIAVFPDAESGGAAQFDLLASNYAGMPLSALVQKWSGGNSSPAYTAHLAKSLGVSPDTVITREMLADPAKGIPFAKAAAQWEAGRPYPMTDEQWAAAHGRVFGAPTTPQKPAEGPVVAEAPTPTPTPGTAPAASPGVSKPIGDVIADLFRDPSAQQPDNPELAAEKQRRGAELASLQFDDIQPAQIQFPRQRQVDLSRLRAALRPRRA